jgi:hypothetical protein
MDLVLESVWSYIWTLLIIEPFSQWKLNKIKTENIIEILGAFFVLLERPLTKSDLVEFIS